MFNLESLVWLEIYISSFSEKRGLNTSSVKKKKEQRKLHLASTLLHHKTTKSRSYYFLDKSSLSS